VAAKVRGGAVTPLDLRVAGVCEEGGSTSGPAPRSSDGHREPALAATAHPDAGFSARPRQLARDRAPRSARRERWLDQCEGEELAHPDQPVGGPEGRGQRAPADHLRMHGLVLSASEPDAAAVRRDDVQAPARIRPVGKGNEAPARVSMDRQRGRVGAPGATAHVEHEPDGRPAASSQAQSQYRRVDVAAGHQMEPRVRQGRCPREDLGFNRRRHLQMPVPDRLRRLTRQRRAIRVDGARRMPRAQRSGPGRQSDAAVGTAGSPLAPI